MLKSVKAAPSIAFTIVIFAQRSHNVKQFWFCAVVEGTTELPARVAKVTECFVGEVY